MPVVKGGVWTNTEDEILKASVSKYGLNQWARVSSLLARKTPKQCKARWSEWLDPGIRKIEWSREEDEKLLHLAKLMPTQWRTIAPIVGRTATQCLERYQKLLDEAETRENAELGLGGPTGGETSAPSADDVRKLRPGELDPDPESKPAKPDTIDMDEDEKEMLSEARARLANTQGKKAKRKARERQLEESRRLALLQKRRELKNAGINIKIVTRKKGQMDYNADIPFEKAPALGFHDVAEEELQNEREQRLFDPRKQQLQNKRKGEDEGEAVPKRRKGDKDAPSAAWQAAAKAGQMQKLREAEQSNKRRPLNLPAPQVGDRELDEIIKMGLEGERALGDNTPDGPAGGLTSQYSMLNVTPMRTPRAAPEEDRVANELRNLRALTDAQSSLLGGENTPLHSGSGTTGFEGATPRHHSIITPNPLATPYGRTGQNGTSNTPMRGGPAAGKTPLYTPRDTLMINGEEQSSRTRQEQLAKKSLQQRLAALPKPKVADFELELPDEQDESMPVGTTVTEDSAERDRRNQALRDAEAQLELRRRTQVMKRGLPRPKISSLKVLKRLMEYSSDAAEKTILDEEILLIAEDARRYPITTDLQQMPKAKSVTRLSDEALELARLGIVMELRPEETGEGWQRHRDWWEQEDAAIADGDSAGHEPEMDDPENGLPARFEQAQKLLMASAETGYKMEKKLQKLHGGYLARAKMLRQKVAEAAESLGEERLKLDAFKLLRTQEESAVQRRLEGLRGEVARVEEEERKALQLYRERSEQLRLLSASVANGSS